MTERSTAVVEGTIGNEAFARIRTTKVGFLETKLGGLRYVGDKTFRIDGKARELSTAAWRTICGYYGLPPDLLPTLGRGGGDLVVRCLNSAGWRAEGAPEKFHLACNTRGKIISVTRADLTCLSNGQVADAVQDALPAHISSETLSVARLDLVETEFELTCHTEQLATEPRPGDILHGGISVRHSQVGLFPTVVLSYVHRLVCSNGMTQRICLHGKPARTKRVKAGNSPERMLEAIRRQVRQAWAQLQKRLRGIAELLKHPFEAEQLSDGLRRCRRRRENVPIRSV